jgi:DNA invertase Pin-like site-specific DNA recombinase
MENVIIYTRVSTDEQSQRGYSLQHQELTSIEYCKLKKYNVVGIYKEDFSAKSFDRPEWKKILLFIKANKNRVNKIIFLKWDRFSRSQYEAVTTIKQLEKLNVSVECIEQPLDFDNPDNLLLLNIYLTVPEIENKKNSDRTKAAMRQAALNGCWVGTKLYGYDRDWSIKDTETTKKKNATLTPNANDSKVVVDIFNWFTLNFYSAEVIRKEVFRKYNKKFSKQMILDILKNVGYVGKVKVKPYKKEPEQIVIGLHPAIIENDLFDLAQDTLKGKTRKHIRKDKCEAFPLKGILKCCVCNLSLTASITPKKNGNKYPYYHCSKTKGHDRYPLEIVHNAFLNLLKELKAKEEIRSAYQAVLIDTINKHNSSITSEKRIIETEIELLDKRILNIEDQIADGGKNSNLINTLNRYISERDTAIMKHATLKAETQPKDADVTYLLELFNSFDSIYTNSEYLIKKQLLSSIFPNPLYFCKNHFQTDAVSPLLELLFLKINKLEGLKIKTGHHFSDLSSCAPSKIQFSNLIAIELVKINELKKVLPIDFIRDLKKKSC